MPRKPNPAPEKTYHKPTGCYRLRLAGHEYSLGGDEALAEQKRLRLISEHLARLSGNGAPALKAAPGSLAVGAALATYYAHALKVYDPRQAARLLTGIEATRALYGATPADQFDQVALLAVREHLLRRPSKRPSRGGKQAPPLSRNYVNSVVGTVQTAWQWLAERGLVPADKAAAVGAVKRLRKNRGGREVPRRAAVSPEVVAATLPHMGPVIRALAEVEMLAGMRPGEGVLMRRCDISVSPAERLEVPDTDPPQFVAAVEVEGGVAVWVYVPARHKTLHKGRRRLVPLGPRAQAVLAPFLAGRDPAAYLFSPREASDAWRAARGRRAKYGRGREPGEHYTTQSYGRAVKAAVRRANKLRLASGPCRPEDLLPEWSPNLLRKRAASDSDEGAGRDTTAALLGHSTPDMAAEYADAALRRAAAWVARTG